MPNAEPVSFVVAVAIAIVGLGLAVYLAVAFVAELRQRRKLGVEAPDVAAFDRDLKRYLKRVWLLIQAWRTRLNPEQVLELDALWSQALERANALQQARARDEEVSADVAELVELEKEIERRITAGRRVRP